jgi:hypothetical protein
MRWSAVAMVVAVAASVPAFAPAAPGHAAKATVKVSTTTLNRQIKALNNQLRALKAQLKALRRGGVAGTQAGPRGLQGLTGPAGPQGPQGAAGPFPGTLPSGKTLRGAFAIRGNGPPGQEFQDAISFGFTLASAPTPHFIKFGDPVPPECPGRAAAPEAQAGHLCIYEAVAPDNTTDRGEFDAVSGNDNTATTFGAVVFARVTAAGDMRIRGSWAVTSP